MTYNEGPNMRRPAPERGTSSISWIVGGIIALAVIFGIFIMFRSNDGTTTASNSANRPQAGTTSTAPSPSPGTTGSGATTPAPANR